MKKASKIGEVAAMIAILNFIVWASTKHPLFSIIFIFFALIMVTDWMLGGIADKWI